MKESAEVEIRSRRSCGAKEVGENFMENLSLARVAKNRNTIALKGFDFIPLKMDGSRLMVVGRVLIAEDALPHFAALPPVG